MVTGRYVRGTLCKRTLPMSQMNGLCAAVRPPPAPLADADRLLPKPGQNRPTLINSIQWAIPSCGVRSEMERHADDCDIVLSGNIGDLAEWVAANGYWDGDEHVCTCYLKDVMARRAIYGDERLVHDLPLVRCEE